MENLEKVAELQKTMVADLASELAAISESMSDINSKIEGYNKAMLELALPEPPPVVELPTPIESPVKDGSSTVKITQSDIEKIMATDSRIVIKDSSKEPELYYMIYLKGKEYMQLSKKETLENFKSIINSL